MRANKLAVCLFLLAGATSAKADCDKGEAYRLETDIDQVKTLEQIIKFYPLYRACNDASVGEVYDDNVSILLDQHWHDVTR